MDEAKERKALYAELAQRELAKRNYCDYLAYVNNPVWKKTRFANFIANEVQKFVEEDTGHAYDVMVIECPPQHGKSMTVTESLPSWYLGKYPERKAIIACYNEAFSAQFCRRNKEKIKAYGANLFGISIGGIDQATEFELDNKRGSLISRSLLGGITGRPASLIIIDDPTKNAEEASSPTMRSKLWNEYQSSLKSRLAAGGKIIAIGTPWHADDLLARIIANEPNVKLLRLPIEAEENDPLGRQVGDALCPELGKDNAWLAEFKASYMNDPQGGRRAWAALYQCSPRIEEGNMFKADWFKLYDPDESRLYGTQLISVDAAFKDADHNDFVAIQVWGKHLNDYYLLYSLKKHLDFPSTLAAIRTTQALYPQARQILIEDKANGTAAIQVLSKEGLWCVPVNPVGGKVARANAVSAAFESGHVFVPDPQKCVWVDDYVNEMTLFPNAAHDDQVDATTQALYRMIYYRGDYEEFKMPEQEARYIKERDDFNNPDKLFNPYNMDNFS